MIQLCANCGYAEANARHDRALWEQMHEDDGRELEWCVGFRPRPPTPTPAEAEVDRLNGFNQLELDAHGRLYEEIVRAFVEYPLDPMVFINRLRPFIQTYHLESYRHGYARGNSMVVEGVRKALEQVKM